MTEPSPEFKGRSVAEAAIKACDKLGVTRAELRYEIIADEGDGLERQVVIRVLPRPAATPPLSAPKDPATLFKATTRGQVENRETLKQNVISTSTPLPQDLDPEELTPKARSALKIVHDVLGLMGLDLQERVIEDGFEAVRIDVLGHDEPVLTANNGEVLQSLQFVVNRILSRGLEEQTPLVHIDAGGYRLRRTRALTELAKRLATLAVERKQMVRLSPMSAADRRIFHLALENMHNVHTRSDGDGLFRKVLIIPGAYEESSGRRAYHR